MVGRGKAMMEVESDGGKDCGLGFAGVSKLPCKEKLVRALIDFITNVGSWVAGISLTHIPSSAGMNLPACYAVL